MFEEKLDKVVECLERCGCEDRACIGCSYEEVAWCEDNLMMDALDVIRDLRSRLDDAKNGRLELARKYLDLKVKVDWLELKPAPNDWGEYPPEIPREGM